MAGFVGVISDWNFWLSIVTALAAVLALYQTQREIKTNNKQHLFDKRVDNYLIVMGMVELYRNNYKHLEEQMQTKEDDLIDVVLLFYWLTNNAYLESISQVVDFDIKGNPHYRDFLFKIEEIKAVATKTKLLFTGNEAVLLGNFVLRYQELLFAIVQYNIVSRTMDERNKQTPKPYTDLQKIYGEKSHRKNLFKVYDNIKIAYDQLNQIDFEKQIQQQIKL